MLVGREIDVHGVGRAVVGFAAHGVGRRAGRAVCDRGDHGDHAVIGHAVVLVPDQLNAHRVAHGDGREVRFLHLSLHAHGVVGIEHRHDAVLLDGAALLGAHLADGAVHAGGDLAAGHVQAVERTVQRLKQQVAALHGVAVGHRQRHDAAAARDGGRTEAVQRAAPDTLGGDGAIAAIDVHGLSDQEFAGEHLHGVVRALHGRDDAHAGVFAVGVALQIHALAHVHELRGGGVVGVVGARGDAVDALALEVHHRAVLLRHGLGAVAGLTEHAGDGTRFLGVDLRGRQGNDRVGGGDLLSRLDVHGLHRAADGRVDLVGLAGGDGTGEGDGVRQRAARQE